MNIEIAPDTKLFLHLYEKIIRREMATFADLVAYARRLNPPYPTDRALLRAFQLLKELHWGFFRELDRSAYTRLWKELVLPAEGYKYAGDLKRNISISNIYVGLMDIHGYTRFCQESKGNLSRLRKLDEFLHEGVHRIARNNSALAKRERGDEIVVVAATATDCVKTILEIINSFSRRSIIKSPEVQRNREDYSIVLPEFKVTAGAAGGNLSTPLIITESGFLSGYLLNTAARLQSLANELAPVESKVIIAQTVHASLQKENSLAPSELFTSNHLAFFNNGPVALKGLQIQSYEVIFRETERYRLQYTDDMEALYEALRQRLWQQKVFSGLLRAIDAACAHLPPFSVESPSANGRQAKLTNDELRQLCAQAGQYYEGEDFPEAMETLEGILEALPRVPRFDPLLLHYAREVHARYTAILPTYRQLLEEEIEKRLDQIFPEKIRQAYRVYRKSAQAFDKMGAHARRSKALDRRKPLWLTLIRDHIEALELQIYVGKK